MTNCYLLIDKSEIIIVDPGDEADSILQEIKKYSQKLKAIILTHHHFDHVLAAQEIRAKTGSEILIHGKDEKFIDFSADRYLQEGDKIKIGENNLKVIHSPGHTQGSICLLVKNEIFVGDLIFAEGYGRIDLPGGSEIEMQKSLDKISKILKPGMVVYPGHGEVFQYKI